VASIAVATLTCVLSLATSAQVVEVRDVVINEIHYDPDNLDLEFVELYNRSSAPLSLAEFEFADSRMAPVRLGGADLSIGPDEFVILARDGDAMAAVWPDAPSLAPTTMPAPWPALNNTGDDAVLLFRGTVIDSVSFVPSWGGEGVSLERIDPNGPSSVRSNWASSVSPSGATPGRTNSVFSPDLEPPRVVFAEHSTEQPDTSHEATVTVTFSEPIVLPSAAVAPFTIDGRVPDRVVLNEPDRTSATLHGVAADGRFLETTGVSDFVGNQSLVSLTPIARASHPGEIVINEIMYDPRADGSDGFADQVEYVEFANTTADFLTLRGLRMTRAPDEHQVVDTLVRVDRPLGIEPDGFAVVFADHLVTPDVDLYTSSAIVLAHPRDYVSYGTVLLPVASQSLGLTNAGGDLYLRSRSRITLDSVQYDPLWHSPNVRTPKGVALERIDPAGPSSIRRNWTSSVSPDGGTPGTRNSVFLTPAPVVETGDLRVQPSPFSPDGDGFDDVTGIAYALDSDASLVRIRIFDSRGRHVRTLVESMLSGRTGSATWDGRSDSGHELRIGIYVVLLESTDAVGGRAERHKASVVLARPLD
jgi:hypothetical protein